MGKPGTAYDEFAEAYAGYIESPLRAHYEWPAVRALLPDVEGKRVLDVACGPGDSAARLAERGADVIGIDASSEMIRTVERRYRDELEVRQADVREPLDFLDDGSVDMVLSQLTLGHVAEWEPVFEEFRRILATDGTCVLSISHPFTDYLMLRDDDHPPFGGLFGDDGPTLTAERDPPRYSAIERYEGAWERATESITFYRRPLSAVFRPVFAAGFSVTGLEEPVPTEELQSTRPSPEDLERRPPIFLCVRATPDTR